MAKIMKDAYDQFLSFSVTMSGVDTLTFSEINLGLNLFQYAGLILTRFEYSPSRPTFAEMVANTDFLEMAICGSDAIASLGLSQPEVYDLLSLNMGASGTPASAWMIEKPFVHDFSNMQGGGILVPAQNIYLGMLSGGFAGAGVGSCRVYYRVIELAAADFIELVQRLRVLST